MLVSLSLAGGIFYLYQKEQALNVSLQREKEELNLNIKITRANLDASQNEVAALGLKLKESQVQIETLTGNLEQEKNTKEEALYTSSSDPPAVSPHSIQLVISERKAVSE
jgi:hypothetical protein